MANAPNDTPLSIQYYHYSYSFISDNLVRQLKQRHNLRRAIGSRADGGRQALQYCLRPPVRGRQEARREELHVPGPELS